MQWAVVSPSIPLGPHSEEQEGLGQWSLVGGEHLDQEWPVLSWHLVPSQPVGRWGGELDACGAGRGAGHGGPLQPVHRPWSSPRNKAPGSCYATGCSALQCPANGRRR